MPEDTTPGRTASHPITVAAFCLAVARKLDEIRTGAPPHVVLEVTAGARPVDVRGAYRRLAKAFHPDTNHQVIINAPGIEQDLDEVLCGFSAARRQLIGHSGPLGTVEARSHTPSPGVPHGRATTGSPETSTRRPAARGTDPARRTEQREKSASDWYREGRQLLASRDRSGAAACFAQARDLEPQDADYNRSIGEALSGEPGRLEEAMASLVEAVRLEPDSGGTWYLLGDVRERLGALVDAREAFSRALALSPSDMRARLAVGRVSAAIRAPKTPNATRRPGHGRFASG